MPHSFAFTRVKLQSLIYPAHDRPISFKTVVIAEMLSILVDSAIAIGVLVGVSVLSVCVFGAIAYAVASRKTKDKDSKYVHLYPVSSHCVVRSKQDDHFSEETCKFTQCL